MKSQNVVKSLIVMAIIASMALGAEIYVSPTGKDGAAGTVSDPLGSIAAARDKADALKAGGTPVTVILMDGTYYLKEPLVFGPSNSGTATAPIIYKAQNRQKAVISGGIKVTGTWSSTTGPSGAQIMKTTISTGLKVDQLFLNGKRQILARYPNYNANQHLQGCAGDAESKAAQCNNPAEGPGYIRGMHSSLWGGNSYIITGKSGGSVTSSWVGDNNRGSGMNNERMVENIYELLDSQGEWFYRKSTGELFFYPPSGTDMSTATVELASVTELLRFIGSDTTSEKSVKYIQFDGVTLTHTFRSLFDGTGEFYEKITRSDWGIYRKGTVFMQNAENITIKNCNFDQIGGNGVFFSGYNRNSVVFNNLFTDVGASCICLFGLKSSIRCYPTNFDNPGPCDDWTPGPKTCEYPAYITISNNMMNRLGIFEKQTSGITGSATMCDTIRHNTMHNMPRAGINFCDGCFGGHVVEYNWVYDCVRETSDHGPFNAWGRDRNARRSSDSSATKLDSWKTTIVRNNRFESPTGMFGIDLDDNASNYLQYNNLLIGGGLKLQWHRYNTYINNILIRGANVQFHGVWDKSAHYGARNIIASTKPCIYQIFLIDIQGIKNNVAQWDSNVVYCSTGALNLSGWSQNENCGSPNYAWSDWLAKGLDAHSKNADPMFTDTQKVWRSDYLPRGDFNPKSGSPALALGFKPFAMDSFGVMPVQEDPNGINPFNRHGRATLDNASSIVNYHGSQIMVSSKGEYRVVITSAAGRTIAAFNGKDNSVFSLDSRKISSGIYFIVVHSKQGLVSHRFLMTN